MRCRLTLGTGVILDFPDEDFIGVKMHAISRTELSESATDLFGQPCF